MVAALTGSTTDDTDAVRYEDVDRLSQPAANIYGGLNIGCTSGFSVIGNGVKGVTTAAHCGPPHTYQGVTLPVKAEKYTTSYDIQWNSAPGFTVQPWAYDGDATPRTIVGSVSRTNTPINAYLCKYGINTQFGCGYVISKSAATKLHPWGRTYIHAPPQPRNRSCLWKRQRWTRLLHDQGVWDDFGMGERRAVQPGDLYGLELPYEWTWD